MKGGGGGGGVICIKCIWSHGKILFLAKIIAGRTAALSIVCPENRV